MITEADTCRKYVLPKLTEAGWDNDPHSFTEQKTFTDGRIIVIGQKIKRQKQKRADYLLRYTRDFMIAVIEAKAAYKSSGDGLQQRPLPNVTLSCRPSSIKPSKENYE